MTQGLRVERQFHFRRKRQGRKVVHEGASLPIEAPATATVPRISRLMALAIRFDHLIRTEAVADQADLARLGHVTRARVTQIMNLLQLAPNIQEGILFLPPTVVGHDPVYERSIRAITAVPDWRKQKKMWRNLRTNFKR